MIRLKIGQMTLQQANALVDQRWQRQFGDQPVDGTQATDSQHTGPTCDLIGNGQVPQEGLPHGGKPFVGKSLLQLLLAFDLVFSFLSLYSKYPFLARCLFT